MSKDHSHIQIIEDITAEDEPDIVCAAAEPIPEPPVLFDNENNNNINTNETSPLKLSHDLNRRREGLDCVCCGDVSFNGSSRSKRVNIKLCGKTMIDLRNYLKNNDKVTNLRFLIVMLCGEVDIKVPKGMDVVVNRCMLCADINNDEFDETGLNESSPCVTITFISLCGDVRVRNYNYE